MEDYFQRLLANINWWTTVGLGGQLLFTMRFVVQWLKSEREQRTVVPVTFWYFSVLGGVVLLIYAVSRADPVIILGQSMGLVIYARNLYFIHRERRETGEVRSATVSKTAPAA